MKLIYTVSILCLLIVLGYAKSDHGDNKISPDKLKQDLSFLIKTLDEVHPNLYFRISKEETLKSYQEIEAGLIEPLNTIEFYERINSFMDSFEDGHTNIQKPVTTETDLKEETQKSASESKRDSINWSFEIMDDDIGYLNFVRMINMADFKSFLEDTFQMIKEQNLKGLVIDLRKNHGGNSFLGVELLNYITDKPYREVSRKEWRFSKQYISILPRVFKSFWTEEPRVEFAGFLTQEPPSYVKGFLCQNPPSELKTLLKDSAPEWSKTYLRNHAPHWLDVEYSPETEQEILSMEMGGLRTPPKPFPLRFTHPTCFLIGKVTFSSAIILANAVEDFELATLFGEETSPCNQFGEYFDFNLPQSQLRVNIATAQFVRANGDISDPNGVLPHHEVKQSKEDTKVEKDTVLEFAKNWINEQSVTKN